MKSCNKKLVEKKIGLVGYLGYATKQPKIGGQLTKTRYIYNALLQRHGKGNVIFIDTSNWKKEKIKLLYECYRMARICRKIIIIPNKNGIKAIVPIFALLKNFFNYKIAYPVVGGWLTDILRKYWFLRISIKSVDFILPETLSLKRELQYFTRCKIEVMPVFSIRKSVSRVVVYKNEEIFKFCTFSRVLPDKGVDIAIKAISLANKKNDNTACFLDVWGPIEPGYDDHYKKLFEEYKECSSYKGILSGDDCLNTLSEYYMLLFPTYYYGEGFPATVCESFMASLPVIASDWRFNSELITQGETGLLIPAKNIAKLSDAIIFAIKNPYIISNMREKAWKKSKEYMPEKVMENLMNWI